MVRCADLEGELAELRALYEQYFLGNERLPPQKKHEAYKKAYARLKGSMIRQTAVKFRIESMGQKLMTYERLWDRTLKEIEAGTYTRDLARLRRKAEKTGTKKKESSAADSDFDVDEDLDLSDLDEADDLESVIKAAEAAVARPKPVVTPVPAVAAVVPAIKPLVPSVPAVTPPQGVKPALPTIAPVMPPAAPRVTSSPSIPAMAPLGRPTVTGSVPVFNAVTSNPALKPVQRPSAPVQGGDASGLSDTKIKAIYDAYVMAKKRCGEDTRAVTLDSVASSLKKQVPELMKQHNAKSVEFKVVIKDGKAVLRALPKE